MKKAELVFIPAPGAGHIFSTVEVARHLVRRDARLSVTIIFMKTPGESHSSAAACANIDRVGYIDLPVEENNPGVQPRIFFSAVMEKQKPRVTDAVVKLMQPRSDTTRLAGFVVDWFCTAIIDVAKELGVPAYMFFTSNAGFLSQMLHVETLSDEHGREITEFKDSEERLSVPGLANPFPGKLLPGIMLGSKEGADALTTHARRFRDTAGIMINTFSELESRMISTLAADTKVPPVYPVGPMLNLEGGDATDSDIMRWLDEQPPSSVVFLCFGGKGSFGEEQVKEIACALERSGHRFLWSLRPRQPKGKFVDPDDHINPADVLPQGFLDRTEMVGKVIGWAPQIAVLAHPAVGGFVSHCGWNSVLESLWFGVPIAAWPMYAEQQFNAFYLVKELDLAVEIRMDYRTPLSGFDNQLIVSAEEIERGIRALMEPHAEKRKKIKDLGEKSRMALLEGGSSHTFLGTFIEDLFRNHHAA